MRNLLIGALGGVAVGALLGILLAPEKGSKTRKTIADKSDDYLDLLKKKLDALKDEYACLTEEIGEKYKSAMKN